MCGREFSLLVIIKDRFSTIPSPSALAEVLPLESRVQPCLLDFFDPSIQALSARDPSDATEVTSGKGSLDSNTSTKIEAQGVLLGQHFCSLKLSNYY